jgi:hypothetical protein
MIFLIEYDRQDGRLIDIKTFTEAERSAAQKLRLERELTLNRYGVSRELVLLEAASKEALHRTHRRYFENIKELAEYNTTENG